MSIPDTITNDFDRVAELQSRRWNHNNHYHKLLLRNIQGGCNDSLEIGCGSGEFCRQLARNSIRVIGIDSSSRMLERAEKASHAPNINYVNMDVADCRFDDNSFDCIVSIATMHHLPYEATLRKMKRWLRCGGTILILDLYRSETVVDHLYSLVAWPMNVLMSLAKNKRIGQTPAEAKLWKEHSKSDRFMTIAEIRSLAEEILPGASIERRLFWRYSLVWHKKEA